MMRRVLVIAACLTLGACSLSQPFPGQTFHALDTGEPAAAPATPAGISPVRVPRARVAPPFRSRAFQYKIGEGRFEPTYFDKWAADPGALVAAAATDALHAAGIPVVTETTAAHARTLELDVSRMYADATGPEVEATVALRATVVDTSGNIVMSRDFDRSVPVGDGDPSAVASAWRETFSAIFAELAQALAGD